MALEDCFGKFPLTSAETHRSFGYNDYSIVSLTVALGEQDNVIRRNKLLLDEQDPKIIERLALIRETSKNMCESNGVEFFGMKPHDHGKAGVVVDVAPEHVIRTQLGVSPKRVDSPIILQAIDYHYDTDLNVTFELLDKVAVDLTQQDAFDLKIKAREFGIEFWDVTAKNIGRNKDGLVQIIDPDSYSIMKNPSPSARLWIK